MEGRRQSYGEEMFGLEANRGDDTLEFDYHSQNQIMGNANTTWQTFAVDSIKWQASRLLDSIHRAMLSYGDLPPDGKIIGYEAAEKLALEAALLAIRTITG